MGRVCPYCKGRLTVGERRADPSGHWFDTLVWCCEDCGARLWQSHARRRAPGGWHGTPLPGIPKRLRRCPSCSGELTRESPSGGRWHPLYESRGGDREHLDVAVCRKCGGRFVERVRRLNLSMGHFDQPRILADEVASFPDGCTIGELKERLRAMFTEESTRNKRVHVYLLQSLARGLIKASSVRNGEAIYRAT